MSYIVILMSFQTIYSINYDGIKDFIFIFSTWWGGGGGGGGGVTPPNQHKWKKSGKSQKVRKKHQVNLRSTHINRIVTYRCLCVLFGSNVTVIYCELYMLGYEIATCHAFPKVKNILTSQIY
jgi:hypothetical protein